MKGIEIAKAYYKTYGEPLLEGKFSYLKDQVAVGYCGSGSECYGFDDELSKDHDFAPGFQVFVSDEVDEHDFFLLEKAYRALPREFMGCQRPFDAPVGGMRLGVMRYSDFLKDKIGSSDAELSLEEWLYLPEDMIYEAVNGEIFLDPSHFVTEIREKLSRYPEEIRRKKLAGEVLFMEQSGSYNYERCLKHNQKEAAQLYLYRYVNAAMHAIFLLNRTYMPYEKWRFEALSRLEDFSYLKDSFYYLLTHENTEEEVRYKTELILTIDTLIMEECVKQKIISMEEDDLEKVAYQINDSITDATLRNMHILSGV